MKGKKKNHQQTHNLQLGPDKSIHVLLLTHLYICYYCSWALYTDTCILYYVQIIHLYICYDIMCTLYIYAYIIIISLRILCLIHLYIYTYFMCTTVSGSSRVAAAKPGGLILKRKRLIQFAICI